MIIKKHTALSNKNSVRSFIGINLPFDLSRKISSHLKIFSKENRNFNYTNIEQYHITLQFLGDMVSSESLQLISQRLKPVFSQIEKPLIETGQMKFGHKSQIIPTVLFLEIQPSSELLEITRNIHYVIKDLNLPDVRREKDYKKLIYHVTLARAKHHISRSFGRNIISIIRSNDIPFYTFKPTHISLLNSRYTIKGHNYSEYSSFLFRKDS